MIRCFGRSVFSNKMIFFETNFCEIRLFGLLLLSPGVLLIFSEPGFLRLVMADLMVTVGISPMPPISFSVLSHRKKQNGVSGNCCQ